MDIRLTKRDKHYIEGTEDVYAIMQRILLRENKVDQEKEQRCDRSSHSSRSDFKY